ncbi:sulfotransferase [Crocosphaera sp.]|uniref:sulfotransferase family protein n=1 Tax=Crocosphaera sp. TaxID=2729996 RepID=UPI0026164AA1|nr:sulfotransferase [Crocosphaera sp.]MDJ0579747.1 sulfotransferase [Crocosphaera sp.]
MEKRCKNQNPIFIVGMPRSGTTLMRSLLSAHPNIAIAPETHFCKNWFKPYQHLDLNQPEQFETFWQTLCRSKMFESFGLNAEKIQTNLLVDGNINHKTVLTVLLESYATKMEKLRWGEKTPDHYQYLDILFRWYPHAQVIWMLRDPRAVSSSLITKKWASSYIDVHARKWCESVENFRKKWSKDEHIILVKYESLVREPEQEMSRICYFLQEQYSPLIISENHKSPSIFGLNHNIDPSVQEVLAPVHKMALEKWREKLSSYQIAVVEHLTRNEMSKQGYQPITKKLSTWQSWRLFLIVNLRKLRNNLKSIRS